jgi:hypothetical protein
MKAVERHPLLASAIGGVLFALVMLVGSAATRSSLGFVDAVLALAVGAAFAFAMQRSMRARRPPRV